MSNSTDEDVQRVLRSRNIGILESEVESVAKEVSGGLASSGAEISDVERQLVIADEGDDEAGQVAESVAQSGRTPRVFGEIDSEGSSDEDANKFVDADDVRSIHSTDSETRHGLDYLHNQQG